MKKIFILSLICSLSLTLTSCYKDLGNYDYATKQIVTIDSIPETMTVLANSDYVSFNPHITSSTDGVITDGNKNYEFSCSVEYKNGGSVNPNSHWVDIDTAKTKDVRYFTKLSPETYIGWYKVKDLRTGIIYSKQFDLKVTSTTYEGWLLLCNEGSTNRARLDMVSLIDSVRQSPMYDIINADAPTLNNATQLAFTTSEYATVGDRMYLLTKNGGYKLDADKLTIKEADNIFYESFITNNKEGYVEKIGTVTTSTTANAYANLCVTTAGDAYAQILGTSGASYEDLLNTDSAGSTRTYQVEPYIGCSAVRPGNSRVALFYDKTNKRFMGWFPNLSQKVLKPISDPEDKLFSYTTGKSLVYMEGTAFSNGLAYAILQDEAGNRSICGINCSENKFTQEAYYPNVAAPNFDKATHFAFSSQYPYMFYSYGSTLYIYNLVTKVSNSLTLDGQDITCLKFNLFKNPPTLLSNHTAEFLAKQYNLLVGTYKSGSTEKNDGTFTIYQFDSQTATLTASQQWTGFGKIQDITYRERR